MKRKFEKNPDSIMHLVSMFRSASVLWMVVACCRQGEIDISQPCSGSSSTRRRRSVMQNGNGERFALKLIVLGIQERALDVAHSFVSIHTFLRQNSKSRTVYFFLFFNSKELLFIFMLSNVVANSLQILPQTLNCQTHTVNSARAFEP